MISAPFTFLQIFLQRLNVIYQVAQYCLRMFIYRTEFRQNFIYLALNSITRLHYYCVTFRDWHLHYRLLVESANIPGCSWASISWNIWTICWMALIGCCCTWSSVILSRICDTACNRYTGCSKMIKYFKSRILRLETP